MFRHQKWITQGLVAASLLVGLGSAVTWFAGGYRFRTAHRATQHRLFNLSHRTGSEIESDLKSMLPPEKFDYQVFVNRANPQELSVLGDPQVLLLVSELIASFDRSILGPRTSPLPFHQSQIPAVPTSRQPAAEWQSQVTGITESRDGAATPQRALAAPSESPTKGTMFGGIEPAPASPPSQLKLPPVAGTSTVASRDWQTLELHQASPRLVQTTLSGLFGARATVARAERGVILTVAEGTAQSFQFGWPTVGNQIYCQGATGPVQQFAHLVAYLDRAANPEPGSSVLSVARAPSGSVERITQAFGASFRRIDDASSPSTFPTSPVGLTSAPAAAADSIPWPVTTANHLQEPLPAPNLPAPSLIAPNLLVPAQELSPLDDQLPAEQDEQQERLRQLRDSVQVETLPDLGIIILRGRQKEVEELSRIIQELERLSADTIPEIKIVELQHTRGDAIQRIIQSVSTDLVNTRQGRVTITPLIKPNALLLVGWGDAIAIVTELIEQLDQPVDANSQFEVFRLNNADVAQLQTSITAFFANREGLGPQVQVVGDARSNSIIVYASPRDMDEVRRLVTELDVPDFRKRQQARVIKVRNALATELGTTLQNAIEAARGTGPQQAAILELLAIDSAGQQVLRSGVLDEVEITPNPQNNSLILSGPAESMELLEALVKQLDVVGSTAQIKVFRIENGDAASLVQMLRSLLPEETTPAMKLSSSGEETSLAPLRFTIDARTNSIIATGSEGDLRIIEALLLRLDEREFSQRKNSVYRLKNAPATDVALAINNFLRSERQAQDISPGTLSPFEQIEREVVVVPEPIGNRLIVSATPRYFEEIEHLIEQLDEPPPQVVIQVLIAEIALDNVHEFGVEFGLQDSILFDRSLLDNLITTTRTTNISTPSGIITTTQEIIQSATNEPGFNFNNQALGNSGSLKSLTSSNDIGGQGLSNFAVGRMNNELGFGGLVLSASSESVSLLIRALEESKRLEVLSRPQVRTLDNQPAFIQVGQRVPRIVGSTVNQSGQSNAITLENVGLILGVTPRISPDGAVVMEVDAERSALGPEADGIPVSIAPDGSVIRSPRIDTTTAQATVSASSGETIILGGLITKRTLVIDRRVPVLSQIPLLGNLFRYDMNQQRRAELLIILTPYVIRGPEDEYRLKQAEYARMSWCICDVEEVHGDIGAGISVTPNLEDSPDTQVIYPEGNGDSQSGSGTEQMSESPDAPSREPRLRRDEDSGSFRLWPRQSDPPPPNSSSER